MNATRFTPQNNSSRTGSTLVLAVVMMFVLFSFLAFSIDTGYLAQSRAEISRTADAAAMAGCWELYNQLDQQVEGAAAYPAIRNAVADMAVLNPVCKIGPNVDDSALTNEIEIGFVSNYRDTTLSSDNALPFFAVKATVNRTPTRNGEIPYFFGRIFGDTGRPMSSDATAVMARNISGFKFPPNTSGTIDLMPFALDVQTWDNMMSGVTTEDRYTFDETTGAVTPGPDGICEVNLYPQGIDAPGNRGTIDIGGQNNSTSDIERQVVDGVSDQDLVDLGKPLDIGAAGSIALNGDTGISAGVKDELHSIIGLKRIIPLFSNVVSNGNNATYTIPRWVGVRVMNVKLTGKMSGKRVIVQPAQVISPYAVVSTSSSQYSDYVLTPVRLAQ